MTAAEVLPNEQPWNEGPKPGDPATEEFEGLNKEIQAGWTVEQEASPRWGGGDRWTVPQYSDRGVA